MKKDDSTMWSETLDQPKVEVVKECRTSVDVFVQEFKMRPVKDVMELVHNVGFRPRMPKSPVSNDKVLNTEEHLRVRNYGYEKRMTNWLKNLLIANGY